jgi:hypothetical protein
VVSSPDRLGRIYAYLAILLDELFACKTCGLTLDVPEFVAKAGLPETFEIEKEVEPD